MPAIELFSANFSPFAQRVRLALLEKGLDFLHTEVDLTDKPEWFLIISPLGQVPVIRHEDRFVSDSSVILEYLEDVYPIPRCGRAIRKPALRSGSGPIMPTRSWWPGSSAL
jgi:glutathione S-transferase